MSKGMRAPGGEDERDDEDRPAKKKRGGPRHVEETGVFQLRVVLQGIEPELFRRLLVPAEMRLDELSRVLLEVMGWEGIHLHRYLQGSASYSNVEFELEEAEDESKYAISELLEKEGDRLEFEYDFEDNWVHQVIVEKLCPTEDGVHYPLCTDGEGACPPEDCGGVKGYAKLAPADPRPFDPKEANDRLRRI